jgi:hypothetical protein
VLSISLYAFSKSILKILYSTAQCVLRNVGDVFFNLSLELGKVCWSSLVHNALRMSKPNQSLQSYEPTFVLCVQKELDRGAESHSGAETLFVQLSHCHLSGNTHSRQPHVPDRSIARLQLNVRYYSTVWRFPPTYCTSTGLPTSTSNFPVSLHHPVLTFSCSFVKYVYVLTFTDTVALMTKKLFEDCLYQVGCVACLIW